MNRNDELATVLSEDVFAGLDRFFGIASNNGVKSVTLDCVTRKVHVEMRHIEIGMDDDADYEAYFWKQMERSKMKSSAYASLAGYKRMWFLSDNPFASYQKYLGVQLNKVLASNFLVLDKYSYTDDYANYTAELKQFGLADKNYEQRYWLLRQMVNFENGRFEVDKNLAGRYLMTRSEYLTQNSIKDFFCFVHICEMVNAEIDELEGSADGLSSADKALLKRILRYVEKGDWLKPATYDNVRAFLSELFENIEFRKFFKNGKAGDHDRVDVSMANILGYLHSHQLLVGGQKKISIDFFGNDSQINNINHGKNGDGNQAFKSLIPLMDKCRAKVIGE